MKKNKTVLKTVISILLWEHRGREHRGTVLLCFSGNIIIKLYSKDLRVKFILEKNNFWCEIGCKDELYFLEDVLSLLNVEFENKKSNLIDYIESVSNIVLEKYKGLSKLFLEENLLTTNEKLKRIGIERAKKMFGIN